MKTYHSGRETIVKKLHDNNLPPNQIVQIAGHKDLQSINNYCSLKERQMENISKILLVLIIENESRTASSTTESTKSLYWGSFIDFSRWKHTPNNVSRKLYHWIQQVFSISIWRRLKMQSQVQNLGRERKKAIYNWKWWQRWKPRVNWCYNIVRTDSPNQIQ